MNEEEIKRFCRLPPTLMRPIAEHSVHHVRVNLHIILPGHIATGGLSPLRGIIIVFCAVFPRTDGEPTMKIFFTRKNSVR